MLEVRQRTYGHEAAFSHRFSARCLPDQEEVAREADFRPTNKRLRIDPARRALEPGLYDAFGDLGRRRGSVASKPFEIGVP